MPTPNEDPENFDEYLEWTTEEEEAFLDILEKQDEKKLSKENNGNN